MSGDDAGPGDGPPLPLGDMDDASGHPVLGELDDAPGSSGGSSGGSENPAPDTSGGGYQFSPEQLEDIIGRWEELLKGLRDDRDKADKLRSVQAPGLEFASGDFVERAGSSGEAYYQLHMGMLDYVEQYLEKLKEAKKSMEEAEERAGADIGRAGGEQA